MFSYNIIDWIHRCLQFPKTVVLYRSPGASLGFSIVGGEDPTRGAQHIHILFVVQESPAAKDGKLRSVDSSETNYMKNETIIHQKHLCFGVLVFNLFTLTLLVASLVITI